MENEHKNSRITPNGPRAKTKTAVITALAAGMASAAYSPQISAHVGLLDKPEADQAAYVQDQRDLEKILKSNYRRTVTKDELQRFVYIVNQKHEKWTEAQFDATIPLLAQVIDSPRGHETEQRQIYPGVTNFSDDTMVGTDDNKIRVLPGTSLREALIHKITGKDARYNAKGIEQTELFKGTTDAKQKELIDAADEAFQAIDRVNGGDGTITKFYNEDGYIRPSDVDLYTEVRLRLLEVYAEGAQDITQVSAPAVTVHATAPAVEESPYDNATEPAPTTAPKEEVKAEEVKAAPKEEAVAAPKVEKKDPCDAKQYATNMTQLEAEVKKDRDAGHDEPDIRQDYLKKTEHYRNECPALKENLEKKIDPSIMAMLKKYTEDQVGKTRLDQLTLKLGGGGLNDSDNDWSYNGQISGSFRVISESGVVADTFLVAGDGAMRYNLTDDNAAATRYQYERAFGGAVLDLEIAPWDMDFVITGFGQGSNDQSVTPNYVDADGMEQSGADSTNGMEPDLSSFTIELDKTFDIPGVEIGLDLGVGYVGGFGQTRDKHISSDSASQDVITSTSPGVTNVQTIDNTAGTRTDQNDETNGVVARAGVEFQDIKDSGWGFGFGSSFSHIQTGRDVDERSYEATHEVVDVTETDGVNTWGHTTDNGTQVTPHENIYSGKSQATVGTPTINLDREGPSFQLHGDLSVPVVSTSTTENGEASAGQDLSAQAQPDRDLFEARVLAIGRTDSGVNVGGNVSVDSSEIGAQLIVSTHDSLEPVAAYYEADNDLQLSGLMQDELKQIYRNEMHVRQLLSDTRGWTFEAGGFAGGEFKTFNRAEVALAYNHGHRPGLYGFMVECASDFYRMFNATAIVPIGLTENASLFAFGSVYNNEQIPREGQVGYEAGVGFMWDFDTLSENYVEGQPEGYAYHHGGAEAEAAAKAEAEAAAKAEAEAMTIDTTVEAGAEAGASTEAKPAETGGEAKTNVDTGAKADANAGPTAYYMPKNVRF